MDYSHLAVVLDLSPGQWEGCSEELGLPSFLSQLLAFLNAHIALRDENTLAVFAALPGKSTMLYSSIDPPEQPSDMDPNAYPPFRQLDRAVVASIAGELDAPSEEPVALVGAMSKALCYMNRLALGQTALAEPRMLVLSVSPDQPADYIPIMNSIFSAQKLKATIDACQIYGPHTVFLQQAAHLTGGSYLHLDRRDALLQYLIMAFLPPPSIRRILAVPTQDKIDFRAACFCHKNIIDVGFVCSVCLSIFCQPVPVCSTCRTKFPIKTLKRLNAARPLPPASSPGPAPLSRPPGSANGLKH
ncbi:General transcription and DNA repair factor IIH subunit tfb4 [Psilocybe cubensis]|nr:General transcription and DNA repair factor IIH subunit tfb4 [Psilocybe cubensis]KAH9485135.1 General transcription and DNA repair factor IIH subunit tfb4 [Psilocybe cubensis]